MKLRYGARKPLIAVSGIPEKAFRAIMFPLISPAGGTPTWVILEYYKRLSDELKHTIEFSGGGWLQELKRSRIRTLPQKTKERKGN